MVLQSQHPEKEEVLFSDLPEHDTRWIPAEKIKELIGNRPAEVLATFRSGGFDKIAQMVHSIKGMRVSIDTYIAESDPVFNRDQARSAPGDTTRTLVGCADGTDWEVRRTIEQTLKIGGLRYDEINYNETVGGENTRNNVFKFFPARSWWSFIKGNKDETVLLIGTAGTWYLSCSKIFGISWVSRGPLDDCRDRFALPCAI